ncbi:MAG: IclR family transcriptional regulator C-terminal domain-containing protein [Ancalomicrobiaceae bacterium]|nr:IclR family transcriptional regulator C-terminal domain-containing protein [Ancalomicrobiaceae bacterium]
MRETDLMAGFAKGLKVIETFDDMRPRLSIADVSKWTGYDRATARRCLLTLVDCGYADFDGKYFSLTPRILRLGHAYLAATPLPRLTQPYLERLSERTGESVSASVMDGNEIIYIARAAQRRVMSINLGPGSRLPAYCASMGRVLLAALPEAKARALLEATDRKPLTPNTKTDLDALMDELAIVRRQGYASIDQELEIGLCSIAVPIENARGQVVAAINIGTSSLHYTPATLVEKLLPEMRDTQADMRLVLA